MTPLVYIGALDRREAKMIDGLICWAYGPVPNLVTDLVFPLVGLGTLGGSCAVRVAPTDSVEQLKLKVQGASGIARRRVRLVAAGGRLLETGTMEENGVEDGQRVQCVVAADESAEPDPFSVYWSAAVTYRPWCCLCGGAACIAMLSQRGDRHGRGSIRLFQSRLKKVEDLIRQQIPVVVGRRRHHQPAAAAGRLPPKVRHATL